MVTPARKKKKQLYNHYRKKWLSSLIVARAHAKFISESIGQSVLPYKCPLPKLMFEEHWHIGHPQKRFDYKPPKRKKKRRKGSRKRQ